MVLKSPLTDFPSARGTYILWLMLPHAATLTIGRLGTFVLAPGVYAYAGSAFGMGGLAGRLRHHLRPVQRSHWHIDYLRQAARLEMIWCQAADTRREHDWARALLALPDAALPIPRFGASDCHCPAHLVGLPEAPALAAFQARLDSLFPDDALLGQWGGFASPSKD